MNPSYIYTALIDVLSYRFRLEKDRKSGTFSLKEDLEGALSVFDTVNSAVFGVQAISDTIILTCNTHEQFPEFLELLREIFYAFLCRNLFIRGGVAYSKHFQNGKLTYSHAVARAYELESTVSIYPRIVIDDNIVQMYSQKNGILPKILNAKLLLRQNQVTFLDVLTDDKWSELYSLAKTLYIKDKTELTESAFSKHFWFENYLLSSSYAKNNDKYIDHILPL
jgi:hypothetical protein